MLTLEQLIKLGENVGVDIFGGIRIPVLNPIEKDVLINTIIEKCGLNIPMYADPYVMASAITVWSAKHQYTFEHVGKIMSAKYSPIENKDYYEDTTTTRERDMTDDTSGTVTRTEDIDTTAGNTVNENKTTMHSGTDTTTDEDTTSASNSSTYQPFNKSETSIVHGEVIGDQGAVTSSSTGSQDKDISGSHSDNKVIDEDETTTLTTHQHGNIGVTSNNQLQEAEYSMLANYNPYNFLAELFENELTLFVY